MASQEDLSSIGPVLDRMLHDGSFPGGAYAVVGPDGTRFEWTGGRVDAGRADPVNSNTLFMLNSTTKVVTALATLQLAEQGRLSIDDPVSAHFPSHPYGSAVTIRHLLNYSSGIPNPAPLKWFHLASEHPTHDERASLQTRLARHSKLAFEPGERYLYSNLAFWLLGALLEAVSGMSLEDYIRSNIRQPLGIAEQDLSFELDGAVQRLARGHQRKWRPFTAALYLLTEKKIWDRPAHGWSRFAHLFHDGRGYGGLYATLPAVAAFAGDLVSPEPRLLSPRGRSHLFSDQYSRGGELLPSGLGFARGRLRETDWFGKVGGGPGSMSNLRVYPKLQRATVVLINQLSVSDSEINKLADELDRHFIG